MNHKMLCHIALITCGFVLPIVFYGFDNAARGGTITGFCCYVIEFVDRAKKF